MVCRDVTFICGRAGVCALGAVAAKHGGDDESLRYYLAQFQQVLLTIELELRLFTFEVVIVVIYLLFIYGLKCNS